MKKIYAFLFGLLCFSLSPVSAQIIDNAAGNNTLGFGYSGNGKGATEAQMYNPFALAIDTGGNLYISDMNNNVIRKVTALTGIIATIAGNGIKGFSGDGGQATSAELSSPQGASIDTAGNIIFSDYSNFRIRKITITSGIIKTYAGNGAAGYNGNGGPATSAELNGALYMSVDRGNNLYFPDVNNNVIREIISGTGVIQTVAGNAISGYSGDNGLATNAQLASPTGVSFDTSGDMYISDAMNQVIREVNKLTGIITTIGGNYSFGGGYTGDGGAATSAEINTPQGIWVRKTGDIVFADADNCVIRKITSSGTISTFAGSGLLGCGYSGDGAPATSGKLNDPVCLAFNKAGDLYVADANNQVVRKISHTNGFFSTYAGNDTLGYGYSGDHSIATNSQLHSPNSVEVDVLGNIYIADDSNQVIRKVTKDTILTIAGNFLKGAGYSGDGGQATNAELNNPSDVAFDKSNNVYIADFGNNVIRKVHSGVITTVAGNHASGAGYSGDGGAATAAELNSPTGVAVDSAGNIFIADYGNNVIREVTVSNGHIITFAGNFSLGAGFGGDGGAATAAQLNHPVKVRTNHRLLMVADGDNQDIRGISAGIIATLAGNHSLGAGHSGDGGPATSARLNNPAGIDMDATGNLFIADYDNNEVREVSAAGIITTIAGDYTLGAGFSGNGGPATMAELNHPSGVSVTDSGIYISDNKNHVIRRIKISQTGINSIASFNGSMTLYPNPVNNTLYIKIGEQATPSIVQIFDITGRMMSSSKILHPTSNITFDVSSLTSGIYIVKVIDGNNKQRAGRFVVER